MAIDVRHIENAPIVVMSIDTASFNVEGALMNLFEEEYRVLEAANGPTWLITAFEGLQMSFGEMVQGIAAAANIGDRNPLTHPNLAKLIVVSDSDMAKFGAEAMQQDQYGGMSVGFAATVDDAIAMARDEHKAAR